METPKTLLTGLQTRGDFQALRKHASQDSRLSSESVSPTHPIWDVWNQIKSAYPGPTANWEAEPPMIWAYAIEGLKPEQIAQGIRNLARRSEEFPPNAGQFRDLCLMDMDWEHKRIKHFTPDRLLERQRTEEETKRGLSFFDNLRAEGVL